MLFDENLVSRYLKPVYGFVYRYVCNAQDAEDITQEVFAKAWRRFKSYDQQKSFKVWLFSIAKNTAIDFLRKKRPHSFSEFEDEDGRNPVTDNLEDPAPLPPEVFERKDLARQVADALQKIPPAQRVVLSLYYRDGFNLREIAEILGESEDTVKSRHRRGLMGMRKFLVE